MSASLHLARHPLPRVPRMLAGMRRGEGELAAAPGLAAARLFGLAELDPVFGGRPTPTRWGLFCAWEDDAGRDAFLADGRRLRPFLAGARESWNVSLETVRTTREAWHGWSPPVRSAPRFTDDEPALLLTYGTVHPRHLAQFTRENRRIVRSQTAAPGLVLRTGMADRALNRATISLWRTEREALDFAYRSAPHRDVQKRARSVPWADDFFFARFRPLAGSGTWGGRDPLGGLRPPVR